jgi:hypothetical protein
MLTKNGKTKNEGVFLETLNTCRAQPLNYKKTYLELGSTFKFSRFYPLTLSGIAPNVVAAL